MIVRGIFYTTIYCFVHSSISKNRGEGINISVEW